MKYGWLACVPFLASCTVSADATPDSEELLGTAEIAITKVPSDVACVDILVRNATSTREIHQTFAVTAGTTASLPMSGLPVGAVVFSALTYSVACSSVTAASTATWVSDPLTVTLASTSTTSVLLKMHRPGKANVGLDFDDVTPPVFAGVTSVSAVDSTDLRVNWSAATDDGTASSSIAYLVCWSTTASGCTTAFTAKATVTGVTTTTVSGLAPNTTYYFVVRARDAANNVDANTVTVAGTTPNDAPPTMLGALSLAPNSNATTLSASWAAGSDDSTPSASLSYQLCWSTSSATCSGASFVAMSTTGPGVTSTTISGLASNTTYFVFVRAKDALGNTSAAITSSATTFVSYATQIAPIFAGSPSTGGCAGGCHLYNRMNTVGVASGCGGLMLVSPGSPINSQIYRKMNGTTACGGAMPAGGFPSNPTYVSLMNAWIMQGAVDN